MYTDLIGIKYTKYGRTKEEGFDCLGLVIEAGKRNGVFIKDFWKDKIENPYFYLERLEKAEKNCIIEINNFGVQHVAFCIDKNMMIHSKQNLGVIIEPISRYKHIIKGYYKVKS